MFSCSGVICSCYFIDTPLSATQLKAAPQLIRTLIMDIAPECMKDIKYGAHQCNKA